jgi:uncharacterized protein DUF3501
MKSLSPADLYTLEAYARERSAFRARVLEHKRRRTVAIGAHVTLIFEDRLTIQYQVQEMLRIERVFEPAGIAEELAAYNPLIPDGANLKATMLIEYPDAEERARRLAELNGVEHRIALQIGDLAPATATADEDMERSTSDKTSAVHFLRFELAAAQIEALKRGDDATLSIDHAHYRERAVLDAATRDALAADLD